MSHPDPLELQLLIQGLSAGLGGDASLDDVHNSDPSLDAVALLRCQDSPGQGITTWATTSLSRKDWSGSGLSVRLELLAACGSHQDPMAPVLASVLAQALLHDWLPAPGRVLLDVMGLGGLELVAERLPHVMVEYPFPWGERLGPIELPATRVFPLMLVPISEAEMALRRDEGREALLDALERGGVEIFDLSRACSVSG